MAITLNRFGAIKPGVATSKVIEDRKAKLLLFTLDHLEVFIFLFIFSRSRYYTLAHPITCNSLLATLVYNLVIMRKYKEYKPDAYFLPLLPQ